MIVYAVDLGTTNIKVALYDEAARSRSLARAPMRYARHADRVEFDPDLVVDTVVDLIWRCASEWSPRGSDDAVIALTGQAESLVLVGADGRPVAPGVSWMDERSHAEALEIAAEFDSHAAFAISGQPECVATWPATKLRWFARHDADTLGNAHRVLMIKDYVLLRLSGVAVGEETTRGFTYLFDVPRRAYWHEMIEFCGIRQETLPEVVPAGAELGPVLGEIAERLPAASSYRVNAGALDHFCTMVGTGTYRAAELSVSAGTVLSLSLLTSDWRFDPSMKVSFHAGLRPGDTVLFGCADSGGVSLGWFQEDIVGDLTFDALERELRDRSHGDAPLFLPYLTGLNPPDFNPTARGAFVDLRLRHDRVDLAYAVMEGVAHLLRRNLDDLVHHGQRVEAIVSAGGGTASSFWNQLKADVCGIELRVPEEPEAACRGTAILALVDADVIDSIDDTAHLSKPPESMYLPRADVERGIRYDAFDGALRRLYGP